MEWVRRWHVTVELQDDTKSSPLTKRRVYGASNPKELRELIEWARRHPHFVKHTEESVRVLDGQELTHCPCGWKYDKGGTMGRGVRLWLSCSCGGHFRFACRQCGKVTIDPVMAFDCMLTV